MTVVELLASKEPLPIREDEAASAARELHALAMTLRSTEAFFQEAMAAMRGEGTRIGGPGLAALQRPSDVDRAGEAVTETILALASRIERMRDRIVAATGIDFPADPAPLPPLPPLPRLRVSFDPAVIAAWQDAQVRWFIDPMIPRFRRLIDAVQAVEIRTAGWSTPAARQVHLDVARFRSRLSNWEGAAAEQGKGAPS